MAAPTPELTGANKNAIDTPAGIASDVDDTKSHRLQDLELWIPASILVIIVLACFVGPLVLPVPGPNSGSLFNANLAPSFAHLLGTDIDGNDVFSRCLYGGRVSIEVGLGAVSLGLVVGSALGILSGYKSGITETLIMRFLDMLLAFPALVLALVAATYLGASERNVIIAIAFFTIPAFARLSRAATLRVRERIFITAARLSGERDSAILLRHIVPNVFPQLLTFALLGVAIAMLVEAALSFLGLGIPPPAPTWGSMISSGETRLATEPWLLLAPSCFLFVTVLALNLVGDALRRRWSAAS